MQNIFSPTELNSDDFETEKFEYTKFRNYIKDGFFIGRISGKNSVYKKLIEKDKN